MLFQDTPGKSPDLHRLVMRRAAMVALAAVVSAAMLGLVLAQRDIDTEQRSALALAATLAALDRGSPEENDALLLRLGAAPLRHLNYTVLDERGHLVAGQEADTTESVHWPVARPGGGRWELVLSAAPDSERREALASFGSLLAVLAAGAVAMLIVMSWSLRRAMQPLQTLRAAIGRIGGGDTAVARALPAMPIDELQSVSDAVKGLADALDNAESRRRDLARQVMTLQEDERAWLARELHDEFGQRLTALRLEASILQRGAAGPDAPAAASLAEQVAQMQQDLRGVLARLAPRAGSEADAPWLAGMLDGLATAWSRAGGPRVRVDCRLGTPLASDQALALYRISQEALTNAARHAGASEVTLQLASDEAGIRWSVQDNGRGIDDPGAALARGNGLAGIRQRIFAFGGDLDISVPAGGGTRLAAQLPHATP